MPSSDSFSVESSCGLDPSRSLAKDWGEIGASFVDMVDVGKGRTDTLDPPVDHQNTYERPEVLGDLRCVYSGEAGSSAVLCMTSATNFESHTYSC